MQADRYTKDFWMTVLLLYTLWPSVLVDFIFQTISINNL